MAGGKIDRYQGTYVCHLAVGTGEILWYATYLNGGNKIDLVE